MFPEVLKKLRKEHKLTQRQLANMLYVDCSAVTKWETGKANPDFEKQQKLAQIFDVSLDFLLGRSDIQNPYNTADESSFDRRMIKVPVLGYVAAGIPIDAIEDVLDYEELSADEFNPNYDYFALKIKGESMTPKIQNGDVVIIRCQPDVESGEIAIVCVNGEEATCKKLKKHDNGISLVSINPDFEPMFFTKKEVCELPVTVLGKVVELRRKF